MAQLFELSPTSTDIHAPQSALRTDRQVGESSALAHNLHEFTASAAETDPSLINCANRLIEIRLGIASSLLSALRQKNMPTASHSLRVALGCSSWAFAIGMESGERDCIEVAALLHDIGKLGAPDRLLLKPGALDGDEAKLMDQYRLGGLDILASCCPAQAIVDIIRHSAGWYNGSRANYPLTAKSIPLGARMLAIVDAFDSMTTDQVYRGAMSRERALHELFGHAGTQFDPELVRLFGQLSIGLQRHQQVIDHWLQTLGPHRSNRFWQCLPATAIELPASDETMFQRRLLDNMHDGVVFVDQNMRILQWNRGAERLTGISSSAVLAHHWSPKLVGMRDEQGGDLVGLDCPIAHCLSTGVQSLRRLLVTNRQERRTIIDVHTVPVVGTDGTNHGVAMLLHDASPEATLEEQCNSLHERATKDPLTKVANRAEFDRIHQAFLVAHRERGLPCSLIICDVDFFKNINDTFGHPAGDEVLRSFGRLLKRECRNGDLVARYGGEEFVLLCADCNIVAAARRAEELRRLASELKIDAINDNSITISFGVTELQAGDTTGSMLRRADRALLEAKNLGRNMVVQVGGGLDSPADDAPPPDSPASDVFVDAVLVTSVPVNMAVEKIRGLVLDHHAEVLGVKADRIDLQIAAESWQPSRRRSDRPVPFLVELSFSEQRVSIRTDQGLGTKMLRTRVHVIIRLKRTRDRRSTNISQHAQAILAVIQSYLMAGPETQPADPGATRRTVNVLAPWLKLRR